MSSQPTLYLQLTWQPQQALFGINLGLLPEHQYLSSALISPLKTQETLPLPIWHISTYWIAN
jgi:hypothetical protein